MATALISIDQAAPNPSPTGTPGRARDDLLLGVPVALRNSDNTDVNRWRWTLKDRPLGSTVVLSSVISSQVTFTPDIPGSYRVQVWLGRELMADYPLIAADLSVSRKEASA